MLRGMLPARACTTPGSGDSKSGGQHATRPMLNAGCLHVDCAVERSGIYRPLASPRVRTRHPLSHPPLSASYNRSRNSTHLTTEESDKPTSSTMDPEAISRVPPFPGTIRVYGPTCAAPGTVCRNARTSQMAGDMLRRSQYCEHHHCQRVEAGRLCANAKLPRNERFCNEREASEGDGFGYAEGTCVNSLRGQIWHTRTCRMRGMRILDVVPVV